MALRADQNGHKDTCLIASKASGMCWLKVIVCDNTDKKPKDIVASSSSTSLLCNIQANGNNL